MRHDGMKCLDRRLSNTTRGDFCACSISEQGSHEHNYRGSKQRRKRGTPVLVTPCHGSLGWTHAAVRRLMLGIDRREADNATNVQYI